MSDKRIRIILDPSQAKLAANQIEVAVQDVGKAADKSIFSVNKLAAAIAGVISVNKIIEYADAWTSLQNQLKQTTTSQDQLAESTNRIIKIAIDTRANLEGTANLYTKFRLSIDQTALSDERLFKITETINKSLALSGATAQESAGALRQLSQAIASGVLRGEEFNSVSEQAPAILKAVQVQTGKTVGELRTLAAQGFITSELLIKSLENYASTVDNQFAKATATFSQNMEVARTKIIAFVGANETIAGAVNLAGSSIVKLTDNLNVLMNLAGAAAALYIARLIPSVLAYTSATLGSTAAQIVARPAVTGLSAALGVQASALTAARVASNLMTLSVGVLRGAMAFLGGPAGIVFLAASALLYFASSSKDARPPVDDLTKSVNELSDAQIELAKLETAKKLIELSDTAKILSDNFKFADENSKGASQRAQRFAEDAIRIRVELEKTNEQIALYTKRQADLAAGKTTTATPGAAPAAPSNKKTGAAEAETANLQSQLDLQLKLTKIFHATQIAEDADYFSKKKVLLDRAQQDSFAKLQSDFEKENTNRAKKLEDSLKIQGVNEEERKVLQQESQKQNLISSQIYEQEKTNILQKGVEDRTELEKEEAKFRLDAAQEIDSAKQITQSMIAELSLRSQASQLYIETELNRHIDFFTKQRKLQQANEATEAAQIDQQSQEAEQRRQDQFRKSIDNDKLNSDERLALRAEYDAQEVEAEQLKQVQLTQIRQEGVKNRKDIDELEFRARLQSFGDLGSSLMQLGEGQNRKVFETGKALALAQAAVALPSSVIQSFENGGGYPWGLIPAAAMLATGLKNIQNIKNAKYGGGGNASASLGGGASSGGGGLPTTNGRDGSNSFQQKQVIEIKGIDKDSLISGQQLVDILGSNDNVIVALNGAQQDAQRRGVI